MRDDQRPEGQQPVTDNPPAAPRERPRVPFVPPAEVEASLEAHEAQRAILQRVESRKYVDAIAQPAWRGDGPEPPLVTYEEAIRGKPGVDYYPADACRTCGAMPYFNGRRIVDGPHDAERHRFAQPEGAADRRGSTGSTSMAIDRAAANLRARRSQGELLDD